MSIIGGGTITCLARKRHTSECKPGRKNEKQLRQSDLLGASLIVCTCCQHTGGMSFLPSPVHTDAVQHLPTCVSLTYLQVLHLLLRPTTPTVPCYDNTPGRQSKLFIPLLPHPSHVTAGPRHLVPGSPTTLNLSRRNRYHRPPLSPAVDSRPYKPALLTASLWGYRHELLPPSWYKGAKCIISRPQ